MANASTIRPSLSAVAVDADGQPANGYREAPAGTVAELGGCDGPSPSVVSKNIYSCCPSAAGADICWPSPPTSMLCMNNPWEKEVRRLVYEHTASADGAAPATPEPFALTLDNRTHCQYFIGGALTIATTATFPSTLAEQIRRPPCLVKRVAKATPSTAQRPCGRSRLSNRDFRPKCDLWPPLGSRATRRRFQPAFPCAGSAGSYSSSPSS